MATRKHHKDYSTSLQGFRVIHEDEPLSDEEPSGNNQCPSKEQVQDILRKNGFNNASEIATEYQRNIEAEDHDPETLMEDLRDPDGSWLADSELKTLFHWTDAQTTKFKQLVLQLMVEREKEVKIVSKHKAFTQSLFKKVESKAFLVALEKSKEAESQSDQQSPMPTYINRAIWYRSDDENLERLIDRAVKEVVQDEHIWSDREFVENVYKDDAFHESAEKIFERKFHFFDRFVEDRYKRQLQLYALFDDEKLDSISNADDTEDDHEEKETNYITYYIKKEEKKAEDDVKKTEEYDEIYEEKKTEEKKAKDQDIYEYHIYPKGHTIEKGSEFKEEQEVCRFDVNDNAADGYEWVWWKRKTKGDVAQKARDNGMKTYGFWEILHNDSIKKQNLNKNGVNTHHLNIIFELLRHYYTASIKQRGLADKAAQVSRSNKTIHVAMELTEIIEQDPTMLNVTYCRGGKFIPVKFEVDIFIHDDKNDALYELTWWNGKARADCNAICIKNKTATLDDKDNAIDSKNIKEKYYMRFCTEDVVKTNITNIGVDWEWYDNDAACYSEFKDYVHYDDTTIYKEGLLHKQLEAIFQSNVDTNYPWKYFDRFDENSAKNCHSFNNAQITHLRLALEENGLHFNTQGYLARFVRLHAPTDGSSEFDLNVILNMEQVAITKEGTSFSRNIRRMKDGKNSLSLYYAGANVFINSWLQNYQLSSKSQRLYFWSFILCIAAKIKQIDIEIENQLVTIPQYEAFVSAKKHDAFKFDEGEVRDEQNDVVLYPGFLVPPVLDGEVATDNSTPLSKTTVHSFKKKVNNLSKTRILRKALVRKQGLMNKGEAETVQENDEFVWYQTSDGEQYRNSLGVMFRFGELIRKFILETKHLSDDTSLWPYYKNYFHRNDHQSYHTLINRFNLSLMYSRFDLFELLEEENIEEAGANIGCFKHFSCERYVEEPLLQESDRMKSKEVAIRHQRKFAAQLLLQKWDSLRNLNILRHQLGPLLQNILDTVITEKEASKGDEVQNKLIGLAKTYTKHHWTDFIQITNKRLENNLNNIETGWQLLTDYDIHRVDSIGIETKKYPFFESFMKHFLLNTINEQQKAVQADLSHRASDQNWYPLFKQSWTITPEWWDNNHDIVLIELALKHGDKWDRYGQELTGDKASDYMMRLRPQADDEEEARPFIPGHTLRISKHDLHDLKNAEIQDDLKPYLEFQHWCRQKSNMLHRLKYTTNTLIQNLNEIKPSLVEIRIPYHQDRPQFASKSLLFSEYERIKHLEYIERETQLPKVDNYTTEWTLNAMKQARGDPSSREKLNKSTRALSSATPSPALVALRPGDKKQIETTSKHAMAMTDSMDLNDLTKAYVKAISVPSDAEVADDEAIRKIVTFTDEKEEDDEEEPEPAIGRTQSMAIQRYHTDLAEESDEDDDPLPMELELDQAWSDEEQSEIRIHDPFIHRNFLAELEEVIHAFNMIKYGPYMARFIINEIREYNMPELWDTLAVVMEAMPFPKGLEILKEQMHNLRRSKPDRLFRVCKEMVDGTNFGVAAALRMAEYFRKVAKRDAFQETVWKAKSEAFEDMAHELIHDIESDHLLYILLTIPLYDTSEPMSILSLALEEKRVNFLNNDRILGIMKHVWYHSAAIHVEETIDPRDFGWRESLQILFFQPFKFYMSPVGFNWTIAVFYLIYLMFVVLWSYLIVKGDDPEIGYMFFWLCNAGFVGYEISEFADKGRQYFSVTGIMNVWDIMISSIWIVLFLLFTFERGRQEWYDDDPTPTPTTFPTTTAIPFTTNDVNSTIIGTASTFVTNIASTFFTTTFDDDALFTTLEGSPNEFINNFDNKLREVFSFLWAIQLFLLSTRFLTLFQNTRYLGSLLKIVQKMFTEIVKFFSIAIVVIAAYTCGFHFIFGFNLVNINGEDNDPAQDFWPTVLFTFDEFIAGGTGEYTDNTVVPLFAIVITIIGFLILTNMLIALMTTTYENFQHTAMLEIAYMWTETVYDLAHRDRLIPPPLNLIVYGFGLLIHAMVLPFAICCGPSSINLYAHFNHNTYTCLDSCYCGCNRAYRHHIQSSIPGSGDGRDDPTDKSQKILSFQTRKIYEDRFTTFLSFSGWMFFRNCCILKCCKKRVFWCCSDGCDTCCVPKMKGGGDDVHKKEKKKKLQKGCCYGVKKCFRKCCCDDYDDDAASLTAYHKGCYSCVKLRVKDHVTAQDTTTIRGISMKQYIERFETKHRTKLHKEDKILLKHLTVDTLFCDKCYQPYLEKDVDDVLLSPFRVLLDCISCVVFLFTAWLPLVVFFSFMSCLETGQKTANQSLHTKTDTKGSTNEYDEFDREFFPHPLSQIVTTNND